MTDTSDKVAVTSKDAPLYRLADPENDLFSDAMDRAVSAHHSVRHGAMRNAERSGEGNTMDGEKIARRALAAGIKAYLEEIGPHTPKAPAVETRVAPPLPMRMDEPWSLPEVLAKLIEATEHSLNVHSCDNHGHELYRSAAIAGRSILHEWQNTAPHLKATGEQS